MDPTQLSPQALLLLAVAVIWTMIWKGIALWNAAKNGNKKWFIVMLVLNTVGVLEILYLYVFAPRLANKEK